MTLMRERAETVPAVERRPTRLWSPAQLIALVLGGVAIAFGIIALTRTGLDLPHLTRAHDRSFGFGHTPLLGLAEIGFGLLLVVAARFAIVGRNLMTLLGAATLGLGIVVVAGWWSTKMTGWLGVSDRNGWLFIAAGGFVLVVSFFTPVLTWGGPRVVRRPVEADATATTEPVAAPRPRRWERLRRPSWLRRRAGEGRRARTGRRHERLSDARRPSSTWALRPAFGPEVRLGVEILVDHLVHVHEVGFLARVEA